MSRRDRRAEQARRAEETRSGEDKPALKAAPTLKWRTVVTIHDRDVVVVNRAPSRGRALDLALQEVHELHDAWFVLDTTNPECLSREYDRE